MTCRIEAGPINISHSGREILSIDKISLGPGGLHFILGPNGAGKTSLLRCILGITQCSGTVRICGRTPIRARGLVSYIPASITVDPWARVSEVFKAALHGAEEPERGSRLWEDLEELGVSQAVASLMDRRFGELSSGEQRLVLIAAALSRGPRLVIADEPLSFLDVSNQIKILALLGRVSRHATVVMTTHEIIYAGYADSVTILNRGRIEYSGAPSGVKEDHLSKVYGIEIASIEVSGFKVFLPRMAQVVREQFTTPHEGARHSTQRSS